MKTKDYSMREMIIDQCLGTGREYTREELMVIVNKELERRDMMPIKSRNTFCLDINEMNEKFYRIYGDYGIVTEQKGRKTYYRYRDGIESIYNRSSHGSALSVPLLKRLIRKASHGLNEDNNDEFENFA